VKAGSDTLINVIRNKEHPVKTLTESDLEMMIGEGCHNLQLQTVTMETVSALIMKTLSNNNICIVFNCRQMALTLYFSRKFFFPQMEALFEHSDGCTKQEGCA
jgi:hypothetical protein